MRGGSRRSPSWWSVPTRLRWRLLLKRIGPILASPPSEVHERPSCDRLQLTSLRAKAHWHLARVLMRQAKYDAALQILTPLRVEFEELGMSHDLACASIDTAESLIAVGRPDQVAQLCRGAIEYFRLAGLAYSTGAMTALAYLHEAAVDGRTNTHA